MIDTKIMRENENRNNRKIVKVGNCNMMDLTTLVPCNKYPQVKMLGFGNQHQDYRTSTLKDNGDGNETTNSLSEIDFFVASTFGEADEVIASVRKLKETNPNMKIVLADSAKSPVFPGHIPPPGVELIIPVTSQQNQAGRSFLVKEAGLLTGIQSGAAAYLAAVIANKAMEKCSIMLALTNLNRGLLFNHIF